MSLRARMEEAAAFFKAVSAPQRKPHFYLDPHCSESGGYNKRDEHLVHVCTEQHDGGFPGAGYFFFHSGLYFFIFMVTVRPSLSTETTE